MKKQLFGFFNRKTDSYEGFVIFDNIDALLDYEKALFRCSKSKECDNFQFADYILYPEDFSIYCLGFVDYTPSSYLDWLTPAFENFGDFDDLLGDDRDESNDSEKV